MNNSFTIGLNKVRKKNQFQDPTHLNTDQLDLHFFYQGSANPDLDPYISMSMIRIRITALNYRRKCFTYTIFLHDIRLYFCNKNVRSLDSCFGQLVTKTLMISITLTLFKRFKMFTSYPVSQTKVESEGVAIFTEPWVYYSLVD